MGTKTWIAAGVVVTAIGVTAIVAHAQRGSHDGHGYGGHRGGYEEGEHRRRGWRGRWRRDMTKDEFDAKTRSKFAKWDANSDGVVDQSEAEARIASRMERRWNRRRGNRMQRMMRRFDTDGDGAVTKGEIEAHVTERFARMDLDGDGRISDADLPPMMRGRNFLSGEGRMGGHRWHRRGHHRKHGRRGRGRGHGKRMMRYLYGADTDKDGAVSVQELQDRASKKFARFDRNKDDVIDKADREALRKEITDYRVRRFMHRVGATNDGKLTIEQFTKHRNERFAKRDRDGSGVIERSERRGGRGHHRWGRDRHDDRGERHHRDGGRRGERGTQ